MSSITRRNWLGAGIALAGSTAAVSAAKPEKAGHQDRLFLECKWIEKTIDGVRVKLRSYNGKVPGELITTRGGDTLRTLKNSLPRVDSRVGTATQRTAHVRCDELASAWARRDSSSVRAGGNGQPAGEDNRHHAGRILRLRLPNSGRSAAWACVVPPASPRIDRGASRERNGRSIDHVRRHRRSARD